jgi:hypothetical protein
MAGATLMTAPALPWMHPAVRALLLADTAFSSLTGGRVSSRLGPSVTKPCATIQATANPIEASAGMWSPLVQVDGWCPDGIAPADPEAVCWNIAAAAAAALSRARNRAWENLHFTARVVDGPQTLVDESRGTNNVLYRAFIRAELTVHAL